MLRPNRMAVGVLALSLALVWGCATTAGVHDSDRPVECGTAEDCGPGIACNSGRCAQVYWIDDTDAGDDIWKPGCHWQFSDAACAHDKSFYKGDSCEKEEILHEYTNLKCHSDPDRNRYDCDRECQRKYGVPGECVTVADACGAGNPSAKCVCLRVES